MAELSIEQRKALALAQARKRKAQSEEQPKTTGTIEDIIRGAASGLARGGLKGLDFGTQALMYGGEKLEGGDRKWGDFETNIYNDHIGGKIFGEEYDPQTMSGEVSKFIGEVLSPALALSSAKNAQGFGKGVTGSLDDYIKDPAKLKDMYKSWRKTMKSVKVKPSEIKEGVVKPSVEAIGDEARFLTDPEAIRKVKQLNALGRGDETLDTIETFRKSLGKVNANEVTIPVRQNIDKFLSNKVGNAGRDAYRRYSTLGDIDDILRNANNQTIKATRTKLNKIGTEGMTAAEKIGLERAGASSLAESALRNTGSSLGAIPSSIAAVGLDVPLLAPAL